MAGGYIRLHRKIREWEWYSDTVVRDVFFHLLLSTWWEDGMYRGHVIKAGQSVITASGIADELGFTEKQVRRALKRLCETHEIVIERAVRFSVVTIENWGLYQVAEVDKGSQKVSQRSVGWAVKGQSDGQSKVQSNRVPTSILKENKNIYSAAVAHLNQMTGQNYKPTTKATQTKIAARLNEGFTLDDLIAVIDKKTADWKSDPKMARYLRPETLFGSKFEGYLNEITVQEKEPERKKYDFTP